MPSDVPPPRVGRVLVVSGDPLVRAGLVGLLASAGIAVTVEPGQPVDAAVWDATATPPPLGAGGPPVLALVDDETAAREALALGAAGAVLRTVDATTLAVALAALERGLWVVERSFASFRPPTEPRSRRGGEAFTPREREVLALLARGLSNRAIGDALGISSHTAKFHVNAILQKLGVERRTEAVARAARLGLVAF